MNRIKTGWVAVMLLKRPAGLQENKAHRSMGFILNILLIRFRFFGN